MPTALVPKGTIIGLSKGAALTGVSITAITNAKNPKVTAAAHGLKEGDLVMISGVTGMTGLNDHVFGAKIVDVDTFKLIGADTTGTAVFGGTAVAKPLVWVSSDNIKSVSDGGSKADEIDITTLASTAKEFLTGLSDSGTFTLESHFAFEDKFLQYVDQLKSSGEKVWFRMHFPDQQLESSDCGGTIGCQALVTSVSKNFNVAAAASSSITIKLSGEMLLYPNGAA